MKKWEVYPMNWFLSLEDATEKIEQWKWEYKHFRPLIYLDDYSPQEFINLHVENV
jgi:putative transposase